MKIFENTDCMDLMRRFDDKFFDLAIVDPPYGIGSGKRKYYGRAIASVKQRNGKSLMVPRIEFNPGDWDDKIPGPEYFDELKRVAKYAIIWGINYFSVPWAPGGRIVWDKVNDSTDYSDCEIASSPFHDSVRVFRYMWNGMLQGKSIAEGTVAQGNKALNEKRIHPTQKPILLYRWLLRQYAKPGWKILDTHVGSASSLIACEIDGYEYAGSELDPDMFQLASVRMKKELRQLSLLEFKGGVLV